MIASGVKRVRWAVILMHRPWCMWKISSHARADREENLTMWARTELYATEKLIAYYRALAKTGVPALMTSFAPCAGAVDLDFVPKLGVDVFEPNMLKIDGSIRSYGKLVRPETLGVRADTGACGAPSSELYVGLDAGQRRRAELAERYLRELSTPKWARG